LPQSAREQETAFDMASRYNLASSGRFNPWQIANSTVRTIGVNKDFVRLDTDVWQNLVMNMNSMNSATLSKSKSKSKKLETLRTTLGEIHRLYTPAQAQQTYAIEFANKLLQNSAITRYLVLQSIERFQSMVTRQDAPNAPSAREFFKHDYKTIYNDYLPLMPKALFCEICIVVMGAGLIRSKKSGSGSYTK